MPARRCDFSVIWNEQYLLHAFPMCNSEWDVTLPVCRVLGLRPDLLEAACPSPTARRQFLDKAQTACGQGADPAESGMFKKPPWGVAV